MVETMQLTEDRLEQFKGHVEFIRMFFTNISKLNPEIKDPEFRNMANCAEIYMMEPVSYTHLTLPTNREV